MPVWKHNNVTVRT